MGSTDGTSNGVARLTLPLAWMFDLLPRVHAGQQLMGACEAGLPQGREWLVRNLEPAHPMTVPHVVISNCPPPGADCSFLAIGRDGRWSARVSLAPAGGLPPLRPGALWLPGPLMLCVGEDARQVGEPRRPILEPTPGVPALDMSRIAGGMLGADRLARLRALSVVIVGTGGNGSHVLQQLLPLRLARITLIDEDRLEPANLGAMAMVGESDLRETAGDGRGPATSGKVQVLAGLAAERWPRQQIRTLTCRAEHREGMHAMAIADVIITATDRDSPRAVAAAIASMFHRVHLDVGSRVSLSASGTRAVGCDVRLVVPGEGRCLLCWGGVANPREVRQLWEPPDARAADPWQWRRAGSLGWVSARVAARAIELLDRLVCGELWHSTWVRDESPGPEPLSSARLTARPVLHCPVCEAAGTGAGGLPQVRRVLQRALGTGEAPIRPVPHRK